MGLLTTARTALVSSGWIPKTSQGPQPEMLVHETACILNVSDEVAELRTTIFYSDKEPAGPYRVLIPARRTRHVRFDDLKEPEPVPRGTDYASMIESNVPVIIQHTRLDSWQAENALVTKMAFADEES